MNEELPNDPRQLLTDAEKQSPVWKKIERYLRDQLDLYRKKNDRHISPEDTANLRGDIRGLKNLLTLGEPAPTVEEVDDT